MRGSVRIARGESARGAILRALALVMVLGLICGMVHEALADGSVSYRRASWGDEDKKTVVYTDESVASNDYMALNDHLSTEAYVLGGNGCEWYVVNKGTTGIQVNGIVSIASGATVNLILCDGAKLEATTGIKVPADATLNIYAQSEGDGAGQLIANGGDGCAGIGGVGETANCGTVIIHGGKIQVNQQSSANGCAGIGGAAGGSGGTVKVYGGTVTANGGPGCAGIGGGSGANGAAAEQSRAEQSRG